MPFVKNHSGNPNGRPRLDPEGAELQRLNLKLTRALAKRLTRAATARRSSKTLIIREMLDRELPPAPAVDLVAELQKYPAGVPTPATMPRSPAPRSKPAPAPPEPKAALEPRGSYDPLTGLYVDLEEES